MELNLFLKHEHHEQTITQVRKASLKSFETGVAPDPKMFSKEHQSWFEQIINLKIIRNLFKDEEVYEVSFHSYCCLLISRPKERKEKNLYISQEDFLLILHSLVKKSNTEWNYQNPFQSFNYTDDKISLRVTIIHSRLGGIHKLFLRKIKSSFRKIELPEKMRPFLKSKKNILISGATGSGKTFLLSNFLNHLPKEEHLVILEDTEEIYRQSQFTSYLRAPSSKLKDLCPYTLRMSPDRIVVGELRGEEAISFLLTMNTGHKGAMATIHANSAQDTIHRLAQLSMIYSPLPQTSYSMVLGLICRNIDYVVYMENRKIINLAKIISSEEDRIFYEIIE